MVGAERVRCCPWSRENHSTHPPAPAPCTAAPPSLWPPSTLRPPTHPHTHTHTHQRQLPAQHLPLLHRPAVGQRQLPQPGHVPEEQPLQLLHTLVVGRGHLLLAAPRQQGWGWGVRDGVGVGVGVGRGGMGISGGWGWVEMNAWWAQAPMQSRLVGRAGLSAALCTILRPPHVPLCAHLSSAHVPTLRPPHAPT